MNMLKSAINQDRFLASICRDSFAEFVKHFWNEVPGAGEVKWSWHLDYFCEEGQKLAEQVFANKPREYDLVVNVSPGTSKSTIFSILLPAWIWTRMPKARILTASHTDALVTDLAFKARTVIKSEKYAKCFPEIEFRDDQDAKGCYMNIQGGDRRTCTVAGKTPTGFHAAFVIIDDPLDPKKALSEAEVEVARKFVNEDIISRKVDKEVVPILLVMQRLCVGDPTDVMIEQAKKEGAVPVRHVCLPAELEIGNDGAFIDAHVSPREIAKRYVNGLMDPTRLGRRVLDEFKSRGNLFYATQFLQKPYSATGGMFQEDYFSMRVKSAPYEATRVRYWDLAASSSAGSCNTAGVLMCRADDHGAIKYFVEDVVLGQWDPYERNKKMRATALRDRAKYGPIYEPTIWIEHEGGASGKEAAQYEIQFLEGFPAFMHLVSQSKEGRARPWSSQLAAKNVYMVDNGGQPSWDIEGYINEHRSFPLGKRKDRVDASAGAFLKLVERKRPAGMRIVKMGKMDPKQPKFKIVVCGFDQREELQFEDPYLLVHISNPPPMQQLEIESTGDKMKQLIRLEFADLDPAQLQDTWNDIVPPYGKPAEELVFDQALGKRLWSFLLRKRDPAVWVFAIVDDGHGDRRGLAVACGIADALRIKRRETIWSFDDEILAKIEQEPSNSHLFKMTKECRHYIAS